MSQVFFNYMSVAVMVVLFYIEQFSGIPLIKALIQSLSHNPDREIVYLVVFYNFAIPLLASLFYSRIYSILNRFWPPTKEEALAKIKFIKDHSLDDPAAALIMVEKELLRLIRRFPEYLSGLRIRETGSGAGGDIAHYHVAFQDISREIAYILSDIAGLELEKESGAALLKLLNIQELITALEQNLVAFSEIAVKSGEPEMLARFFLVILESQEFLLLHAVDTLAGNDSEDLTILKTLTADNGETVKQVRTRYLEAEKDFALHEKATLYKLSSLFERTVWLLNRLSSVVGSI